MDWLAITLSDDWYLFVQHRSEFDLQNLYMMDEGHVQNSKVIRTFEFEHEAVKYCRTINDVSALIEDAMEDKR